MKDGDLLIDLRALLRHAYETSSPNVTVTRSQLAAMVDALARMLNADEEFRLAYQRGLAGPLDASVLNYLPEPKDTRANYVRIRWGSSETLRKMLYKIRRQALMFAKTAESKRLEAFATAITNCEAMELFDFFERTWIPVGWTGILKMFEGRSDVVVRVDAIRADSSMDPPIWHVKFTDLELSTEHERTWQHTALNAFFRSACVDPA